jgi:hypothetical protein
LHKHLCLFKAENDGFRTGDFFEVHFEVFDDKLKVLDLTHNLTLIKNRFFKSFEMSDVFMSFVEIIFDEFNDIFTIHLGTRLGVKKVLFKIFLGDFLLSLGGVVKIHFDDILDINVRSLIAS